jgi:ribosomal protein S18 acetylase RimI-like enzyme
VVSGHSDRFTIKPAGWGDLQDLVRLENECFKEDAWPWWDLLGVLAFSNSIRLKAIAADENIAGFIAADIKRAEKTGWITTLGVRSNYRRLGIARKLLSTCEEFMAMPKIHLCVRTTNRPALQLYNLCGYNRISTWTSYYGDGEDAYVLEKLRYVE